MGITLIEAAKLETGDVVRSSIIEIFARSSPILRVLPFDDIVGNALRYTREDTLPGIGFRGVNEAFSEDTGVLNPLVEPLVIAGGDLDVDMFIIRTMGENQRSAHEAMKIKKLGHTYHQNFIKGDSETNPRQFDGLQRRLTGDQNINNGGGALTLTNLDALADAVDMPTHFMMTQNMRRRLTAASRDTSIGGFITQERDAFGMQVSFYQGLPILIADENGVDGAAITEDEESGSDKTSIYCLSLGDAMLTGIQNGGMDVRDLGELDSKSVMRTRVEWYTGLALFHPRAAARLRNIDPTTAVTA